MLQIDKGKSQKIMNSRSNRMKTFSIEYLTELCIIAMGMINRQLQIYYVTHDKHLL